jgi:hypothetical protein
MVGQGDRKNNTVADGVTLNIGNGRYQNIRLANEI